MKSENKIFWVAGFTAIALLMGFLLMTSSIVLAESTSYDDPYICAMHPHIVNEGEGRCEECQMRLSKLNGHIPGTPLPPVSNIYASHENMMYVHEGPGKDPNTNSTLIPITESPIYTPPKAHDHNKDQMEMSEGVAEGTLYTCGMHPDVIQNGPGTCPICGMDLTPMKKKAGRSPSGERVVAYWVAPMDPNFISEKPGKSPMGMDLVPVYEDQLTEGVVTIDPATIQSIGVTTSIVESRDLSVELRSNGIVTIAEDSEYRVNPKISGWIEKLYVNRTGEEVRKGDALLEIYSPQLVSAQEEFLLAVDNAKLLSGSGLDRVSSGAKNLINSARRRLELWDISTDQINALEKTCEVKRTLTLYSPANGVVLHKNAVEGAAVKAGMDLFTIVNLNSIWVDAQIFESELTWVHEGDAAQILSSYDPNISISGEVEYIYPFLDTKTRTAKVRIVVPNGRRELKPDMYVDVRISTQTSKDAVAVQKNAVIRSGKRDIVFLDLGEGRFMPREVKIGLETDDFYEISYGLTAGTSVVTSAQFLLDSEAKLQEAVQRRLQKRNNNIFAK